MLGKQQALVLILLIGFIGGCAMVGVVDIGLTVFALLSNEEVAIWIPFLIFGLFILGAVGTIGTL